MKSSWRRKQINAQRRRRAKIKEARLAAQRKEPAPPYPWCIGSPTREACAKRAYCNRNPSCGD